MGGNWKSRWEAFWKLADRIGILAALAQIPSVNGILGAIGAVMVTLGALFEGLPWSATATMAVVVFAGVIWAWNGLAWRRGPRQAQGTSRYLADMEAREVRKLGDDLKGNRLVAGDKPAHSLEVHPTLLSPGVCGSTVTYDLKDEFLCLYGAAGIADIYEKQAKKDKANSPMVFEIHGDGKQLWKSRPLQKSPELEFFRVSISGVKTLTLKVDCCLGDIGCAWAVWVEPILCG